LDLHFGLLIGAIHQPNKQPKDLKNSRYSQSDLRVAWNRIPAFLSTPLSKNSPRKPF